MSCDYVVVAPAGASVVQVPQPARCAFADCQAGGDILDRAPRVVARGPVTVDHSTFLTSDATYHPGCYAAFLYEPPVSW